MLKLETITSQCSSPPIQPRRDVKINLLKPHIQQPAENPYKAVECCSINVLCLEPSHTSLKHLRHTAGLRVGIHNGAG